MMNAKKVFRKIHLWLSVPTGIFIALICFSGAMMVFEKEITELCRHDLYFVQEVKGSTLPEQRLVEIVTATLPDSVSVTGIKTFPEADRAWQVSLSKPRRASVFIDQYTGEIKGRYERLPFFDTMFHLHRWLLDPSKSIGKWIVGVCTLLLVIILVTGLLMWLTNRKKPLTQSLKISCNKGWHRFWHDLHVAGGIYATIFLLAMALTGLTWSFSWYRTGFYAMLGVDASAGGHGRPATDQVAAPRHPHHEAPEALDSTSHRRTEGVGRHGNHSEAKAAEATPRSGSNDRAASVRSTIYKIHTGGWGGIIAKIITFLAALLGATLPITGYYLWIRRLRNKSKNHRQHP